MAQSTPSALSRNSLVRAPKLVHRAEWVERSSGTSLGNLWQMPLLLVSLGLFTLAAYLFIDPRPAPSFQRQLALAARDVEAERYDAAIGRLNDLLATRPERAEEAQTRLLVAIALDKQMRRSRRQESPQAYRRIVAEIQAAYAAGAGATADTSDRLARSFEALGQVDDAAANYRRAVELLEQAEKAEQAVPMRRSAIDMLVAHDRQVSASAALEEFLDVGGLSDDERAWALGELARVNIDAGRPAEAKGLLAAALALSPDESIRGQVNYRLGYAAWKLGENAEAESRLKLARQQIGPGHVLDADACYLLGRLAQEREALAEADEYYQVVLRDHADSRAAPKAQLGRGTVKLVMGEDEQGVSELAALADEVATRPALAPLKSELLDSLRRAGRILTARGKYQLALDLMTREQTIEPQPQSEFFARQGLYLQKLAEQLEAEAAQPQRTNRPALANRARELYKQAGDAYVAYSQRLTIEKDARYAQALWRGVELYERAGAHAATVAALETFCVESAHDAIAPEALLRLGRAYQASGGQDKATDTFVRLRSTHPQSPAAAEAALALALAYVAQGETRFADAEDALRSVTDGNPAVSPESQVGRRAVWELGHLYYRMGRYEEALARLELMESDVNGSNIAEAVPAPQLAFLKADCHRKAATQRLAERAHALDPLKPAQPEAQLASTAIAPVGLRDLDVRRSLDSAKDLFAQTIDHYRQTPPATPLDETYERLAYFYRADCLFDLGQFEEAIELYTAAAHRYQDDPSTLAAHVQLVNAYTALGRTAEARTANERAKWLLKRVPPEAFTDGRFTLSRDYWEQWVKRTGEAGI